MRWLRERISALTTIGFRLSVLFQQIRQEGPARSPISCPRPCSQIASHDDIYDRKHEQISSFVQTEEISGDEFLDLYMLMCPIEYCELRLNRFFVV